MICIRSILKSRFPSSFCPLVKKNICVTPIIACETSTFPLSRNKQAWASEVSEILDYVRDWVYLHPSAPRSRPERPEHPSNSNSGFASGPDSDGNGAGEGEFLPWTGGEEHVQEWAEFLWRVARPGVPVGIPVDVEGEEDAVVAHRGMLDEQGGDGGGGGCCGR